MVAINVQLDAEATMKMLKTAERQLPYAIKNTLNDLAFKVQTVERFAMLQVFETPRPFTARSVRVDQADRDTLSATVYVTPAAATYLEPYEEGGVHVLPGPALLKPVDIKLDQYGQLPNKTMEKLKARPDIYIGPIKTKAAGVINGVWQRVQINRQGMPRRKRLDRGSLYHPQLGALRLLIRFGVAVEVRKHLDFHARAIALVGKQVAMSFKTALTKALATAR